MMKISLLISLFCCIYYHGFSQGATTLPPYKDTVVLRDWDTSENNIFSILRVAQAEFNVHPNIAIEDANVALKLAKEAGNKNFEGRSYYMRGKTLHFKGDLVNALEDYLTAINIHDSINNHIQYANDVVALGYFYYQINDYTLSQIYLDKLKYFPLEGDTSHFQALVKITQAKNFVELNDLTRAGILAEEALATYKGLDSFGISEVYYVKGIIQRKMHENQLALDFLKRSAHYCTYHPNKYLLVDPYVQLCEVFYEMKMYDSAINYSLESYQISKERNYLQGCMQSCKELSRCYYEKGDTSLSNRYQRLFITYSEQYFDLKKAVYIKDLTLQKELGDRAKAEQDRLAEEEDKQNLAAWGLGIAVLLFIFLFVRYSRRLTTKERNVLIAGEFVILAIYEATNIILHFLVGKFSHSLWFLFGVFLVSGTFLIWMHHWLIRYLNYEFIPKNTQRRIALLEAELKEAMRKSKDAQKNDDDATPQQIKKPRIFNRNNPESPDPTNEQ